ncbi:hypothetical protein GF389_04940 [Candidatus Dojkabacteria bacterium]|nr:hypothetical protein [Candidatus Dojkabacteria bacterium]
MFNPAELHMCSDEGGHFFNLFPEEAENDEFLKSAEKVFSILQKYGITGNLTNPDENSFGLVASLTSGIVEERMHLTEYVSELCIRGDAEKWKKLKASEELLPIYAAMGYGYDGVNLFLSFRLGESLVEAELDMIWEQIEKMMQNDQYVFAFKATGEVLYGYLEESPFKEEWEYKERYVQRQLLEDAVGVEQAVASGQEYYLAESRRGKGAIGKLIPGDRNVRLELAEFVKEKMLEGEYDTLINSSTIDHSMLSVRALRSYLRETRRAGFTINGMKQLSKDEFRELVKTDLDINERDLTILFDVIKKFRRT